MRITSTPQHTGRPATHAYDSFAAPWPPTHHEGKLSFARLRRRSRAPSLSVTLALRSGTYAGARQGCAARATRLADFFRASESRK